MTTTSGEQFTEKEMLGKWSLVYFGFTNCPDICPEELDKVGSVLNKVGMSNISVPYSRRDQLISKIEPEFGKIFLPIFISVDPARDTPDRIGRYLDDFHPSFVGLVGPHDSIKTTCKAYRVYFSTPPDADPKGDYLVDHSIFVYLMDPEGRFVEAFGQSVDADKMVEKIRGEVIEWEKSHGGKTVAAV